MEKGLKSVKRNTSSGYGKLQGSVYETLVKGMRSAADRTGFGEAWFYRTGSADLLIENS